MNGLSVSCPNPPASNSRSMHKPARTRSPKIVKSGVTGTKILRRGPEEKYAAYAFKGASRCLRGRVSVSSPLCGTRKCPSYPRVSSDLSAIFFTNQGSRCSAKIGGTRLLKQCQVHTHPVSQFKLRHKPIATNLQHSSLFIGCRHPCS